MLESLAPLFGGVVLATGTLCNGERLRLDKRDETAPAALRARPRDRVLFPRDSFPAKGAWDADWGETWGQSIEASN